MVHGFFRLLASASLPKKYSLPARQSPLLLRKNWSRDGSSRNIRTGIFYDFENLPLQAKDCKTFATNLRRKLHQFTETSEIATFRLYGNMIVVPGPLKIAAHSLGMMLVDCPTGGGNKKDSLDHYMIAHVSGRFIHKLGQVPTS